MMAACLRLAAVFFALNAVWELLRIRLYTIWWSEPWSRIALALLHCTAGDVLIGALALVFAITIGGEGWPAEKPARRRVVLLTTLAGVGYTVFSEWLNVELRHTWTYTDLMPRIPPLGTGLAPVLQWLTLPGLALGIACVPPSQNTRTRRPDRPSAPTARNGRQPP